MKYSDWLEEWLECFVRPVCKYKTYISYAGAANRYIAPALGGCEVAQLDGVILQKFVACLVMRGSGGAGRRLSTSTVNLIITVMQSSLKCAFMAGKTAIYAADNVKRPRVIERDTQCFTSREQAAIEGEILRCNRTNLYGIVICLYTGLRIGELLALRWEDIDFRRNLLYVNRTGHDGRDGDGSYVLICNSPKTASSKRCIPLPRQMAKLLRGIRERSGGGYVISNKSKPVLVRSYQRSFERLLKKLNIPRRGFHALRHTFATRAVECGMDIKMLSEILGHKSPAVTLNRYVHSFMAGKRKMMNRLGEVSALPKIDAAH